MRFSHTSIVYYLKNHHVKFQIDPTIPFFPQGKKKIFDFASIFLFEKLAKIDASIFKRSPNHPMFFFGPNNRLSQPFMPSIKDSCLVNCSQAYTLARILRRAIWIFCFLLRACCYVMAEILKQNVIFFTNVIFTDNKEVCKKS